jgi:hypothetical protein
MVGQVNVSEQRSALLVVTGLLALSFLVGAILVWLADRWRRRQMSDETRPGEEMTSFRALYERGEISKEEYDRIRTRMAEKLKQKLNVQPTGAKLPATPVAHNRPEPQTPTNEPSDSPPAS